MRGTPRQPHRSRSPPRPPRQSPRHTVFLQSSHRLSDATPAAGVGRSKPCRPLGRPAALASDGRDGQCHQDAARPLWLRPGTSGRRAAGGRHRLGFARQDQIECRFFFFLFCVHSFRTLLVWGAIEAARCGVMRPRARAGWMC